MSGPPERGRRPQDPDPRGGAPSDVRPTNASLAESHEGPSLLRHKSERLGTRVTTHEAGLLELVRRNDPWVHNVMKHSGRCLGEAEAPQALEHRERARFRQLHAS